MSDPAPTRSPVRWGRRLGWTYLLLLVLSHLVSCRTPEAPPDPDQYEIDLPRGPRPRRGETITVRWRDTAPDATSDLPALLVLSHYPDLTRLILDQIPRDRRGLAPDLPMRSRTGDSTGRLSIDTQAQDVHRLLDDLGLGPVHVIGHRLGGGVALALAEQDPGRVGSLALLSSVGPEEYDLFGDHYLNKSWHGLYLAGAWLIRNLIPHFGALDHPAFDPVYVRSLYRADLRPMRRRLQAYAGPARVLHDSEDARVTALAAQETWRLLPQADWTEVPGAGQVFLADPAGMGVEAWLDFVHDIEAGRAVSRSQADPDRIAQAAEPFRAGEGIRIQGVARAMFLALLFVISFVSEDLTSIAAGLMVARGSVGFGFAVGISMLALYLGTAMFYGLGRWLGVRVLRLPVIRWIAPEHEILRSQERFHRHGDWVILVSRILPGIRLPVYLTSGLLRVPFLRFSLLYLAGLAVWGTLLVALASRFGPAILDGLAAYNRWTVQGLVALVILLAMGKHLLIPSLTWRGRRLLAGRWQRLRRWEYWSGWVFHAPLVPWILWLAWRHRGLTVFTAAHPGWSARRPAPEAASGHEFALVVVRTPGAEPGRVLSIARREDLWLTGDGRSTLERLILAHPESVAPAPALIHRFAHRLYDVLPEGERICLAGPGRPGQGTRFQAADHLGTPEVEAAVAEVLDRRPGLDLARIVVRSASDEAFRAGRFDVAAIQGVASLVTRTGLPSGSWPTVLRRLAGHWQWAFEVGAARRRQGHRVMPPRMLLGRLLAARRARQRRRALDTVR